MRRKARIAGCAGISAALLLGAGLASAAEAGVFHDGPRRVAAERLGPSGPARTPVRLRYEAGPGVRAGLVVDAFVDRTAIVKLDPGGAEAGSGAEAALAGAGARAVRPLMPSAGLWLVESTGDGDGLDLAVRLHGAAGIRAVVPNLHVRLAAHGAPYTPNDPMLLDQWYWERIGMLEAWGIHRGDPGATIVIVDTGCDMSHPDLAPKLDPGLDVIDGDDDPSYDPAFEGAPHGTACAGLAAAATDNGVGIAGGCPECRLRCVRHLSDEATPLSTTVDAFNFALQTNAAVVSNSWSYADPIPVPQPVADAIQEVFTNGRGGKGALVLFAAGNENREIGADEMVALPSVLAIGATTNFDDKTSFTNYGAAVELVAPAGTVTTDITGAVGYDPSEYTNLFGGTSSACPVAAGVAGLLASAAPDRTAADLYDVMIRTARPAPFAVPDGNGHDPVFGYGIVDPVAALSDLLGLGGEPAPAPAEEDGGCAIGGGIGERGGAAWLGAALVAALSAVHMRRRRA